MRFARARPWGAGRAGGARGTWAYRPRERPLSCLGDASEVALGGLSDFAKVLPRDFPWRKVVRKWWEWDYIAACAERLDLLGPSRRVLGLGAGTEPLMFYFASRCGRVVATDLYGSDSGWPDARVDIERMMAEASIPFDRDALEIRHADMRATGEADGSVDLVWSTSSIEHVGNLKAVVDTFGEVHRVLRPGGHAVLTTEYCLSEPPFLHSAVTALDPDLFASVAARLGGLELVGTTDLSYNHQHPGNAAATLKYYAVDWARAGHRGDLYGSHSGSGSLISRHWPGEARPGGPFGSVVGTFRGGHMAVMLGMSLLAPVGLVLRKTDRPMRGWNELRLPEHVRKFVKLQRPEVLRPAAEVARTAASFLRKHGDRCSPQLRLHALAIYAETAVGSGAAIDAKAAAPIYELLEELPKLGIVDAIALDPCAALLAAHGDDRASADLYWACMTSPSTSIVLALRLGLLYVGRMSRLGSFDAAAAGFAILLRDLVANGVQRHEIAAHLADLRRRARKSDVLGPAEVDRLFAVAAEELRWFGDQARDYLHATAADALAA